MIKVGIVGGTGYTGVELLRLLAQHPEVQLVAITSRGDAGTAVSSMFPSLRRRLSLQFEDPARANLQDCDVVFFATPNGVAMQQAPALLDAGVRVIDLAADFRIRNVAEWSQWYGMQHSSPEWVADAVYGLPEYDRADIRNARLLANPGCYPTAVQLGFMPLLEAGVVELDHLVADAKSGVSGAGRKAEIPALFSEAADNFKAYAVPGHRHLPEIRQGLSRMAGSPVGLTFVPHLTPFDPWHSRHPLRAHQAMLPTFRRSLTNAYQNEPFVDVLPSGLTSGYALGTGRQHLSYRGASSHSRGTFWLCSRSSTTWSKAPQARRCKT
jgi:N-acetyl-gamma-glutamyl-phosphate reductase